MPRSRLRGDSRLVALPPGVGWFAPHKVIHDHQDDPDQGSITIPNDPGERYAIENDSPLLIQAEAERVMPRRPVLAIPGAATVESGVKVLKVLKVLKMIKVMNMMMVMLGAKRL